MPITSTPIRYPGGKSKLYSIVSAIVESSNLLGCTYAEAYCGGAGLAMKLLLEGKVSKIVLNDIDPAVYSMWEAIIYHPEEMCTFIREVPLTIDEWKINKHIFDSEKAPSIKLGKAAFFLNRTNRSGILKGGPIGGLSQSGRYGIDARFNRESLCKKIARIADRAGDMVLCNLDAHEFIDSELSTKEGLFAYFDPPYIIKGPGLYENHYTNKDHREVAKKITSCHFPWIVTYDDSPLARDLYRNFNQYALSIGYSAASIKTGCEILISGPDVTVPDSLGLNILQERISDEVPPQEPPRP